jgi:hypothetical protein
MSDDDLICSFYAPCPYNRPAARHAQSLFDAGSRLD